jgi:hypothetical protein
MPVMTRPKGVNGSLSCVGELSVRLMKACVVLPHHPPAFTER